MNEIDAANTDVTETSVRRRRTYAASMAAARETYVEPEFVSDKVGAVMLAVSPRTFAKLVQAGQVTAIKVPKMRRVVYDVASIRALAARWRAGRDA
jgi:hypothetical protein